MKPPKHLQNNALDREIAEGLCKVTQADFVQLITGQCIGRGVARAVYECRLDPTLVIKIEDSPRFAHNVMEWQMWQTFKGRKSVAKWLAPCVSISAYGAVLIQKRTKPLEGDWQMPARLPWWMPHDRGLANFGKLGRRTVCHDYGFMLMAISKKVK